MSFSFYPAQKNNPLPGKGLFKAMERAMGIEPIRSSLSISKYLVFIGVF